MVCIKKKVGLLSDHRIADILFNITFADILEIEFKELGEPAVFTPDCAVVASDKEIMRSCCFAVSAFCCWCQFPDIITGDWGE